mgnify:CR=1 FL=1
MFKPIGYIVKDMGSGSWNGEVYFCPAHAMRYEDLKDAEPVFFSRTFKILSKMLSNGPVKTKKRPKLNKTASNIATSGTEW